MTTTLLDRMAKALRDLQTAVEEPDADSLLELRAAHALLAEYDALKARGEASAESELAGMRESEPPCRWKQDEEGNWDTRCGNKHILIDGTPADNRMRFCCYCGKEICEGKA